MEQSLQDFAIAEFSANCIICGNFPVKKLP